MCASARGAVRDGGEGGCGRARRGTRAVRARDRRGEGRDGEGARGRAPCVAARASGAFRDECGARESVEDDVAESGGGEDAVSDDGGPEWDFFAVERAPASDSDGKNLGGSVRCQCSAR